MGVLIVLGLGVIFATIAKRATSGKGADAAAPVETTTQRISTPFGDTLITIPRGARMVDFRADGSRLLIHVRPPGVDDVIHIIDMETGKLQGSVTVGPRGQ